MNNKYGTVDEMLNSNYDVAMMESTGLDQYLIWLIQNNFNITSGCNDLRTARYGSPELLMPRAYISTFTSKDDVKLCIHELYKSTREKVIETTSIIMTVNSCNYYFSKGLKAPTEKEVEVARILEEWADRWLTNRKPKMANNVCGSPATPPPTATANTTPPPFPTATATAVPPTATANTTPPPFPTATATAVPPTVLNEGDINEITKIISGIVRDLTSFRREIKE